MVSKAGLSQEYVQDSSSGEEQTVSKSKAVSKSKSISQKTSAKNKQSSEESSESASDSSSGDSSESDSESSTSNPTSNGTKRKEMPEKSSGPTPKKSKSSSSHPARVPPAPYQPPTGYTSLDMSEVESMTMFDPETLSSKQIWHITAPASVPITSIKSLDMQTALRGEAVLEHNGTKFNIYAMPVKDETLLLPSGTDFRYSRINAPVTRNLNVREMTMIKQPAKTVPDKTQSAPSSQTAESDVERITFTASEVGKKRIPRPEVKGLMMRYHPYGSATNGVEKIHHPDRDEEEVEETQNVQEFRAPPDLPMDLDSEMTTRTPKNDKKSRKRDKSSTPKSSQVRITNGDAMDIDSPVAKTTTNASQEKRKKKRDGKNKA